MLPQALEKLLTAVGIPDPIPTDPFPTLIAWLDDARVSGKYQDPNAMAIATATRDGMPSVRMVLCKDIDAQRHAVTFYTNYQSRKGDELAANPRVAVVFHWHHAQRQARIEGTVEKVSAAESDAYFQSRPLLSRIGAVVSDQSKPIASRAQLVDRALRLAGSAALGTPIARPAHWGGFRINASTVELWSACEGRLHQRVVWQKSQVGAAWTHELLSP